MVWGFVSRSNSGLGSGEARGINNDSLPNESVYRFSIRASIGFSDSGLLEVLLRVAGLVVFESFLFRVGQLGSNWRACRLSKKLALPQASGNFMDEEPRTLNPKHP